jgi:hypothetical protein
MAFPLTLAAFRTRYQPTFDLTPDALVQAKLDEAEEEIDAVVWGTKAETGHGLLTAHKLAMEPGGRDARLKNNDGKTTYGVQFDELAQRVGGAYRVVLE